MPRINYGAQAYRRDNGNLPELRLINMFLERAPSSQGGIILLSRKGLEEHSSLDTGPVQAVFQEDGVFGGDVFSVAGNVLYRGTEAIGTITVNGPVFIAASASELAVCGSGPLYRYDGSTLVAVTFPDGASVTKVVFHDGLFLAARLNTQKWYFSAVLDADTWDALDFGSAESSPDNILDMAVSNDTMWLFGSNSTEPHANTGDADLPYQRFEQRIFPKGVKATGTVVALDNTLYCVTSDGLASRLGETLERISDNGIEERIAQSETISCFGFVFEGHSFYCIRLDAGTFAFDVSTQQWCEFQSDGSNFRGRCACMSGTTAILGGDNDGTLWTFGGYLDGDDALTRLFTAGAHIDGGTLIVDNFMVEANVGWTEQLSGQGSDPVIEVRFSRDGGATWGDWRPVSLGAQGRYRNKAELRRCGMFDFPGMLAEVRNADPVPFRVSGVLINEAGGGRARG